MCICVCVGVYLCVGVCVFVGVGVCICGCVLCVFVGVCCVYLWVCVVCCVRIRVMSKTRRDIHPPPTPPLQPRELSEWQHNPEELFHELEGAPADSDRLRPAAERLWLYAARHHTPAVTTLLATQLPAMLQAAPPGTGGALPPGAPALVRKAAVYAAVGLASSELYEHLGNFQELLHGALVPDMGCVDAAARPVQRQVVLGLYERRLYGV